MSYASDKALFSGLKTGAILSPAVGAAAGKMTKGGADLGVKEGGAQAFSDQLKQPLSIGGDSGQDMSFITGLSQGLKEGQAQQYQTPQIFQQAPAAQAALPAQQQGAMDLNTQLGLLAKMKGLL